jgi:hypothetical protein
VSVNGKGIETLVAINSSGTAGGNHTGLFCDVATNCSGRSPGNSDGIYAARAVTGCIGYSNTGTGIEVGGGSAVGCNGYSNSNTGLIADTAAFCTGFGGSGGIAIYATIATGCSSQGSSTITYKYNMP